MSQNFKTSRVPSFSAPGMGISTEVISCGQCKTDAYILIERASRRKRKGLVIWDVDYTCTNCDNFYGHEIRPEALSKAMVHALVSVIQRQ